MPYRDCEAVVVRENPADRFSVVACTLNQAILLLLEDSPFTNPAQFEYNRMFFESALLDLEELVSRLGNFAVITGVPADVVQLQLRVPFLFLFMVRNYRKLCLGGEQTARIREWIDQVSADPSLPVHHSETYKTFVTEWRETRTKSSYSSVFALQANTLTTTKACRLDAWENVESALIAEQLTLEHAFRYESMRLCDLTTDEDEISFSMVPRPNPWKELRRMLERLTEFVVQYVLTRDDKRVRKRAWKNFAALGAAFINLRNFAGARSVYLGLMRPEVASFREKLGISLFQSSSTQELGRLFGSETGKESREILLAYKNDVNKPVVPDIEAFLREAGIWSQEPNFLPSGLINLKKKVQEFRALSHVLCFQGRSYPISINSQFLLWFEKQMKQVLPKGRS